MRQMIVANLQWTEMDYARAKREHLAHGTQESELRAVVAWRRLEKAKWLMGTLI